MNLTRILSIFFLIVAIVLGGFLYYRINLRIEETAKIERTERQIIQKLKWIREAQTAYQAVNGQYTDSWDSLINFIDNGNIPLVQRTEEIITLDYGVDSVVVDIDTLAMVNVYDSLFNEQRYPTFNLNRLPYIPGKENQKFILFADKVDKSELKVDVIEVKDFDPINPSRDEDSKIFNQKPLRFGSKTEASITGNWE